VAFSATRLGRTRPSTATWLAAAAAAALFAFSPLIWQYATTAEVFALNNLLCALVVHRTLMFAASRTFRDACLAAFTVGLALTNQHTAVLFGFPLAAWAVFFALRHRLTHAPVSTVLWLGLSGLAGLAPYVYLPLAALLTEKPGSWGDVRTLSGFVAHFVRADYGTFQLYSGNGGTEGLQERLALWAKDTHYVQGLQSALGFAAFGAVVVVLTSCSAATKGNQLGPSTAMGELDGASPKKPRPRKQGGGKGRGKAADKAKASMGVAAQAEEAQQGRGGKDSTASSAGGASAEADTRGWGLALVLTLLFYLLVFHYLANLPLSNPLLFGVNARFWQQPFLLVALFAGVGLSRVLDLIGAAAGRRAAEAIGWTVLALVVVLQVAAGSRAGDQSSNEYFRSYATSILEALPPKSLLLINYDQQWTSCRYFQVCEGVGSQVTLINLSMMTFKWWNTKQHLYPKIKWPGTHYVPEQSVAWKEGGFTADEFLEANLPRFKGGIYIGGQLSYSTDQFVHNKFDFIPYGMVSKVARRDKPQNFAGWKKATGPVWNAVFERFPSLPLEAKFGEDTWEWTVGREFYDHVAEHGAHILDLAVNGDFNLEDLLTAAQFMELAVAFDPHLKTATLKNLGLAYLHVVKDKTAASPKYPAPRGTQRRVDWAQAEYLHRTHPRLSRMESLVEPLNNFAASAAWNSSSPTLVPPEGVDFKSWASERFLAMWRAFINRPDAHKDPSYSDVLRILKHVEDKATGSGGARGGARSPSSRAS